ncbi:hypothetical protein JCM3775_007177 [Rhodotorula graminis]
MASNAHDEADAWPESDDEPWSEDEDEVDALDVKAAEKRLLMIKDFWHALNKLPMLKHAAYLHACTMEFRRLCALHVRHDGPPSEADMARRKEIIDAENVVADKQRVYIAQGGDDALEADGQLALIVDLRHDLAKQAEEEEAELSSSPNSTAHKEVQRARALLDAIAQTADVVTARGERYLEAYAVSNLRPALYHLNQQHPLLRRPLDRQALPVPYPLEHHNDEDARNVLRSAFERRHQPGSSSARPRRARYNRRRRQSTLQRVISTTESSMAKAGSSSQGGLRRGLLYFGRDY